MLIAIWRQIIMDTQVLFLEAEFIRYRQLIIFLKDCCRDKL